MKRILFALIFTLCTFSKSVFALSFDCKLEWKPIIPCPDARFEDKPYFSYKITPLKDRMGVYSVKLVEQYVDLYCGDRLFASSRREVSRRRLRPSVNSQKYVFAELTIYKEKGKSVLQAEGPLFDHAYPVGTCTVKR